MIKNIFQSFSKILKISKIIVKSPISKNIFLILLILILSGAWQIKKDTKKVLSEIDTTSSTIHYDDFHLIISKINVDAPIIPDVNGADKDLYFNALEKGVAHLEGSAKPGEGSNIFIFGHSSFYTDEPGDYKEIFRQLEDLKKEDEIIIWHTGKEYRYKVTDIKIVSPQDIDILKPTKNEQVTLMTCVPPGTIINRLIVVAELAY